VRKVLERGGFLDLIGADNVFATKDEAISRDLCAARLRPLPHLYRANLWRVPVGGSEWIAAHGIGNMNSATTAYDVMLESSRASAKSVAGQEQPLVGGA
jgi:hypothetical protein